MLSSNHNHSMHNSENGDHTPDEKPKTANSVYGQVLPLDFNNKSAIEYYAGSKNSQYIDYPQKLNLKILKKSKKTKKPKEIVPDTVENIYMREAVIALMQSQNPLIFMKKGEKSANKRQSHHSHTKSGSSKKSRRSINFNSFNK